jgi:hypothetical protein
VFPLANIFTNLEQSSSWRLGLAHAIHYIVGFMEHDCMELMMDNWERRDMLAWGFPTHKAFL